MIYKVSRKFFTTIVLLLLILVTIPSKADNAQVSLLTCSPGDKVYELFGHTALRYTDSDKDIVFGYGYFSFDTPNFAWRFILGETDYMVGAVDYNSFVEEYKLRGAGVTEQIIPLDSVQKRRLFKALTANCRPHNRVYRYNYFYNNCTTKIRDILTEHIGSENIIYKNPLRVITIREALAQYTSVQPWTEFGINLLLGADVDEPVTREVLQFLPCNLMKDYAMAQVTDGGGKHPLVCEQNEILQPVEKAKTPNHLTPFNCALLLLLFTMIIMLCEVRSRKIFWWYDVLLLLAQGLSGTLLLFMAIFSHHPAVDNNYLLIWLNPLPLLIIPLHIYCTIKHRHPAYMWAEVAMAVTFIVSAPFVPQCYPAPIFIFATTILVRSIFNIYRKRICELSLY